MPIKCHQNTQCTDNFRYSTQKNSFTLAAWFELVQAFWLAHIFGSFYYYDATLIILCELNWIDVTGTVDIALLCGKTRRCKCGNYAIKTPRIPHKNGRNFDYGKWKCIVGTRRNHTNAFNSYVYIHFHLRASPPWKPGERKRKRQWRKQTMFHILGKVLTFLIQSAVHRIEKRASNLPSSLVVLVADFPVDAIDWQFRRRSDNESHVQVELSHCLLLDVLNVHRIVLSIIYLGFDESAKAFSLGLRVRQSKMKQQNKK